MATYRITSGRYYASESSNGIHIVDQSTRKVHNVSNRYRNQGEAAITARWLNERDAGYPVPGSLHHMAGGQDVNGKTARPRARRGPRK